jgi:hypothetical protein
MKNFNALSVFFLLLVFHCSWADKIHPADIEIESNLTKIKAEEFASWDNDISLNFCVIADPHCSEPVKKGYEKFGTARDKFNFALKHIKNLPENEKPSFIIVPGDIYFDRIEDLVDESGLKFYFVAGNHESVKAKQYLRESFPEYFQVDGHESDYYSFIIESCRFVGICDAIYPEHVGMFSSEQITPFGQSQWLEKELGKNEPIKIVFGHIPPHPKNGDKKMWLSRNDSLFFNDLIKRTQPTLMFFGHQHRPTIRIKTGKTNWFIVRSLSWNTDYAPIGYLNVRLNKDGAQIKEYLFK